MRGVLSLVVLVGSVVSAQTAPPLPNAGLDRLILNPGPGPVVGGDGKTLGETKARVSIVGHYEHAPLILRRTDGGDDLQVITHRVQAHVVAAFGVFDWLDVQLQIPLVVFQEGDDVSSVGLRSPASFGVGSPVLGLRAGVLSVRRGAPIDFAAQVSAALPLGSPDAMSGNRTAVMPSLHIGRSFELIHIGVVAGATIESAYTFGSQLLGSQFELTGTLGVGSTIRGEVTSHSVFSFVGATPTSEVFLGLRALLFPVDLFVMGGPSFGTAPGTPQYRVLAGLGFGNAYKPKPIDPCTQAVHTPEQCPLLDDDRDGVPNGKDLCPLQAEDLDGFEDGDGCIDKDNDQDTIFDISDKCPNEKGTAEYQGCPVPDKDGDGILDADDQCPTEAGIAEKKGCPFRDVDRDGLEDAVDACPTEAGLLELKGCPPKDRDGDGVFDHLDNCPDQKGVPENQGCPSTKKQLVVITKEKLVIKEKVYFATGKATILARSYPLLDQVAEVIQTHAELKMVVIEGHTDSTGKAETNRRLSQDRAMSVKAYLIKRGIDPARLSSEGYGPDRPAAPNDTADGRELNRRVEFTLPQQPAEGGSTP